MNEANLFTMWLDQDQPSKLTAKDIQVFSVVDVTTKFSTGDLVAIMYWGRMDVSHKALACLKEQFETEMHRLEELTYPQGAEE